MQYDAGFLLYQLQYAADYEEQTSVENTRRKIGFLSQGSPSISSLPDLLQTSNSYISTLPICHKQHLELISQWTNVVGSIFKTTRHNQDSDMELKVKLQKHINKNQEEKIKLNRKNAGNSPMISSTPSIFFCWRMEKSFEIGLGDVSPPPPLHFTFSISESLLKVCVEAESAMR